MIEAKVSQRWQFTVMGDERGSSPRMMVVNSVDDDPKVAKVTLKHEQVIVPITDLVDLLQHIEGATRGKRDSR